MGNSVKFTDRGHVFVDVSVLPGKTLEKRRLLFCVEDTGCGIPDEKLDVIFDPFTQASESMARRHQGAGLGLSIVRRLVRLLGGTISVESEPGKGTTMCFTLLAPPAGPEASAPGTTSEAALPQTGPEANRAARATQADGAPREILVVEDDRINTLSIVNMLRKLGYAPHAVADGGMVVPFLEGRTVDAVLMDIQLPTMDGVEATRAVRDADPARLDPKVPIIAMTAYAMEDDRRRFLAAGMDAYISKPVDMRELADTLRRILGGDAARPATPGQTPGQTPNETGPDGTPSSGKTA